MSDLLNPRMVELADLLWKLELVKLLMSHMMGCFQGHPNFECWMHQLRRSYSVLDNRVQLTTNLIAYGG